MKEFFVVGTVVGGEREREMGIWKSGRELGNLKGSKRKEAGKWR